ncbi:MAG: MSHA pilin protein MshA [Candidatus Magnetoglobus multicellularis str. Araruama]|uniref:MSHA pilin protein MshA n=1 Tax=Candidatus Magnetoglobus multicellularis str. Araruama TaxID=890399 RepID=A0A1V1PF66_9BACT|nr:MAG: MSHA pilin protein MshA [Candidatus Magnetoglobus multicellularis str. Araruama]
MTYANFLVKNKMEVQMYLKNKQNCGGFTLIEIIVVLVILGILAAIIVPKYINIQDDARLRAIEGVVAELQARSNIAYAKGGMTRTPIPDRVPDVSDINGVDSQYEIVDRPLPRREQYITVVLPNGNTRVPVYYIPPRDDQHELGPGPACFFPFQ